jgi:hypothetical protein
MKQETGISMKPDSGKKLGNRNKNKKQGNRKNIFCTLEKKEKRMNEA